MLKRKHVSKSEMKKYTLIVKKMLESTDTEKIDKLKKKIKSDCYMKNKFDIEKLAQKLLEELDL